MICLTIVGCDKFGNKTISGEFRSASEEDNPTVGRVEHESMYDFRSDGTFTMRSSDSSEGVRNVFTGKGRYTIKGRNVELEQTFFAINDRPMGDRVTHATLLLEENGDLITSSGTRLKKQ